MNHVVLLSGRTLPDDLRNPFDRAERSLERHDLADRSADVVHEHAVRLAVVLIAAERGCCPQEALGLLTDAAALTLRGSAARRHGNPVHEQAYRVLARTRPGMRARS